MASSADFVLKAYKTEANARADTTPLAVDNVAQAAGSTVDNPSQATTYGFWAFQRYWYRIEANEPVSEFHIDWDDGEDNSPKKANVSIIKNDKPSFVGIVSHIYTQSKSFYPLIRVKSVEGFLSKWYTSYSILNTFDGLDDDIKTDGNDKGQNSFSVVSVEKNDGTTTPHARIPIFKPANVSPVGVLKTDRKKVFAGMDNVWLGDNSRILKGDSADEMPYSHLVHAICSNPERTGAQAKVTYQEGRIGGISAVTEVTTNEYGTYSDPVTSIRGFNANDLDQKLIYVTSMDETYACYFVWTDGASPAATSNASQPVPTSPYTPANTEMLAVTIDNESESTGLSNYVSSQDLALRLAATLTAKQYHGRAEFSAVAGNTTATQEVFTITVGNGGPETDSFEDGLATASITFLQALSIGNTVTIENTAGTSVVYTVASEVDTSENEFAASHPGEARDTLVLCINASDGHNETITAAAGNSGSSTGLVNLTQVVAGTDGNTTITRSGWGDSSGTIVQWSGGSAAGTLEISPNSVNTVDDGLATTDTGYSSRPRYGNYFTFSEAELFGITPIDYYVWMRQAPVKEQFTIDVTGDSFLNQSEKVYQGGGDHGLTTTFSGEGYGNYFTFTAENASGTDDDYYAWFRQAPINEVLTITMDGPAFEAGSPPVEKTETVGRDGLSTWVAGSPEPIPVGHYFQFSYYRDTNGAYNNTDYVVRFEQQGQPEKTTIIFSGGPATVEDEYIILYDRTYVAGGEDGGSGDKYLIWFDSSLPPVKPTGLNEDFHKRVDLTGDLTADDVAETVAAALGTSGWLDAEPSGGYIPFSVVKEEGVAKLVVTQRQNGATENYLDSDVSDTKITTTTTQDGKDDSVSPDPTYHEFSGSQTIITVPYVDGYSDLLTAQQLTSVLNTAFTSYDNGLSVARDDIDVTITAEGALGVISTLQGGSTPFPDHDGLASGGSPNVMDLSTGFTFSTVTDGVNLGLDPLLKQPTLASRTGIPIDYADNNSEVQIATNIETDLDAITGISASRSANKVTILNDHAGIPTLTTGAIDHATDGTDESETDDLDLSTGFDLTTGRIDGKNIAQDPVGKHGAILSGMTDIPVDYIDGETSQEIANRLYAELVKAQYTGFDVEQDGLDVTVTMDSAGPTDDVADGSTTQGSIDLSTGFNFAAVPRVDATGRYTVRTTHINKGVIPVATFQPAGNPTEVSGATASDNCVPNDTDLFERVDDPSGAPLLYYGPRIMPGFDGVDASDGSIKQKTLTCGTGFADAGAQLNNVSKILKMELVNNLENADSYGGSTGTSTLVPGERIYLQTTLNPSAVSVEADDYIPSTAQRLLNLNLSGTVCSVSLGSPIVEENLIGSKLSVDATESKVRCSNKSISYFYIDDNKLISGDVTGNTSSHQAADTNNVTDKLVGGADFKSTTGSKDLWYTFDWWREHQDANYRYYPYKRLIRAQIEDNHGTSVADDAFNLSPIVHWDSSAYLTIGSAAELPDGQPSEISKWNYGVFLFTDQAKLRTPNWSDLNANNREDRIPIFSSNALMSSNSLADSSAFDTLSTADHYAPDNRYDAKGTEDMSAMDDVGPRNALFMARKEKFDRIFVRVSHDRFNAAGQTITNIVPDITVGTTIGWPKMRMQVLYPAKKTRNSSTIIWKPLPVIDRTMLEGKNDSSLYKSGDIVFIPPADWEKTSHSASIEYPYEDNFFDDGTTSGTNGIDDKWNKASYALIFLITQIASTGAPGSVGVELVKNVFNVMSMYPYNNSHSQLIEIVDPTHVSLNKFGIAQSVSFVRKGKFQEIKDRSGISLMRRIGAEGGKFKLGGIDLKGDPETTRSRFNEFQKDGVPVYYDILHKDDSITRLFGVMTDMSEDHPTAGLIPKFACSLTVTHILEIDSSGNIKGKGYKPLGGDVIDVEQYLSTS